MPEITDNDNRAPDVTVFDLVQILLRRRRLIYAFIAVAIVLGLLLAFLTPKTYRATTQIVPSAALAPAMDQLNLTDFRAAASQLGLNLGSSGSNPSPLFPSLLAASELQAKVLARSFQTADGRSVDLATELKLRRKTPDATTEVAAEFFRVALQSSFDFKTGITSISLILRDPVLAAGVLNAFVEEMNTYMQTLRSGQAGQKVRFISQRLVDVQDQLAKAESDLTEFRLRNRQIEGSPQLQLEERRLTRDVDLNEQLFLTLKTQLEIARIDEVRNLPDVITVEKAHPPIRRDAPRRAQLMAVLTFVGGFLGVCAAFALELLQSWRRRLQEPAILGK